MLNWDKRLHDTIGKILRVITPDNAVRKIRSGVLKGEKWIVGSGSYDFWMGTYEKAIAEKFETYAKKSEVVCDLGAHVGYYTLLASKSVGKHGKVYAFEPLHRNIIYLQKHIELNKISNVRIFECAVSNVIEKKIFFTNCDNKVANTICKNSPMFQSGKLIGVNSVTLDDLLEKEDIMVPQLIKMDIEGAEYDALKGAKHLLKECHPSIFLSTHNCQNKGVHKKCCDFLVEMGYNLTYFDYYEKVTDTDDPWYDLLAEYIEET